MTTVFQPAPSMPPPSSQTGVIHWVRSNLFNSLSNSFLTLVGIVIIFALVPPLVNWLFLDAIFLGTADVCRQGEGACWAFVDAQIKLFLLGPYPIELVWRPIIAAALLFGLFFTTARHYLSSGQAAIAWILLPIPIYWLIGGGFGLQVVDTSEWGGLLLTLVLAIAGILASVPIGVLLALGRTSETKLLKGFCICIIELVRGVPLVTILFMATIMLPLFLPDGVEVGILYRVQFGIILFSSAYIAEVVRGGLQGVGTGQSEAAVALGLNSWQTTAFIILPQALKIVIPPLIGRCIALLKDTSLVVVVGLLDFLGIAKAASQDAEWLGFDAEAFVFCAFIYWILCFSLSRYGRSLEKRGQTSH
ncbi:amino acid ABC transporter permease [Kiloniella antarctica]|uniref:Amino acid ABC transporter permease n=1 Tax=Kiloniella antarctica TaxID=1550907 RepID=A0ABW5BQG1_9PROT